MKRAAGLCVLGLLCLHSWVLLGQNVEEPAGELMFCNSPVVKAAAKAAVTSFNKRVVTGNKMALYQILSASKAENASGVLYSIQFNSRKSDCPAGVATPWSDCGYLVDDIKEPRPCNASVYESEAMLSTLLVECNIEGLVQSERADCLGCPVEMHPDAEELKGPITAAINTYNTNSDATHLFMLSLVNYATRQVVAGFRYQLYFEIRKSNCLKAEHTTLHSACAPNTADEELANCNSTVDTASWRHEDPQIQLNCEPAVLQSEFTRRRPPGWSPLRNIVDKTEVPTTETPIMSLGPAILPQPAVPIEAAPPAKEESSEEDDSTKAMEDPFHCPSKPWKKFTPAQPTATPTDATVDVVPVDGALVDQDLLG